ncbi:hypothetical protein ACVRZP_06545 [Streptococcus gallolyticus subsp. gallolyticus]
MELDTIYNEDCLSGMAKLPSNSIDMILCDLPYGSTRNQWDSIIPFDRLWEQYERLIKDNGAIVLTAQPLEADCIVSNPPFSKRDAIFKRLFEIGLPFAIIMNPNGLFDSKVRYELFKNNNFELLIPKGRMRFFDENMISRNSPNFQSVYVCNRILNHQIEFTDMQIE